MILLENKDDRSADFVAGCGLIRGHWILKLRHGVVFLRDRDGHAASTAMTRFGSLLQGIS